jgi:hypothetical protein
MDEARRRRRAAGCARQDTDGDYVDYCAKTKREEFHAWHSVVSDWEVEALPDALLKKA